MIRKVGSVKVLSGPFKGQIGIINDYHLTVDGDTVYSVRINVYQTLLLKDSELQQVRLSSNSLM